MIKIVMFISVRQMIFILICFQSLFADESLYEDYKTPRSKKMIERLGMEFGYDYIETKGIAAHRKFGFDEDISSVGTRMSFSYLLWELNDSFDVSASINWSYQEPYYMGLTYYGLNGRYYIDRNHAFRFLYTIANQGEIGGDKRDLELGTGKLWGVGYEYKLNNTYRFFLDYKKASLEEASSRYSNSFSKEYTKYNVNMFSIGLGANFTFREENDDSFKEENDYSYSNDGDIEDLSISLGYVTDSMSLQIKDDKKTLNYGTREGTSIPIIIKSKSKFLNKSETIGYKLFSLGFNLFDYNKRVGSYSILNVPEEVVGHYIYITPSIFYTNTFDFMKINHSWKLEASSGVSFLTLDAKNLNYLDVENQWGTYNALSAEVGMNFFKRKNLLMIKYSYIKQKYDNHHIKYNIDGNSFGMYVNFKFKDIFSKDW